MLLKTMLPTVLVATTAWVANQHVLARAFPQSQATPMMSAEAAAKAAWLAKNPSAWSPPGGFVGSVQPTVPQEQMESSAPVPRMTEEEAKAAWLASHEPAWSPPGFMGSSTTSAAEVKVPPTFVREPVSHFALELLAAKGSRRASGSLVDVGEPHDFSRPLATDADGKVMKWNGASVGSWACTPGGWDSPKLRPTTETFLVIDGAGSVTDVDGMIHHFGAGDVVVLPKHWSGRWDISEQIHKIWVVHDHPDVAGAADGVVRAVVASVPQMRPEDMPLPLVQRALHDAPAHLATTVYDVGPTRVGFLSCAPGSFVVSERLTAECFFVVDGVFFLTNPDGSACRCVAGDTVVLPKGWAGRWDIVEPVTKVWVEVGYPFPTWDD